MKRLPHLTLFIALLSATAFADHLYLVPNSSGDNFGYVAQMNGHPLDLSGGTNPGFLSSIGYQPGSTAGGSGELYLYSTVIWFNGTPTEFDFAGAGSIFMTPIQIPTDGRDFLRAPVEISFSHTGTDSLTGLTLDVSGGASGSIAFYLAPDGLYHADAFVQAPEPGTLAFMGTGLMTIMALARKRLRI